MRYALLLLLPWAAGAAVTPAECRALEHHGKRNEARACFTQLTRAASAALRAEGSYGLREYEAANQQFRLAHAENDKNADLKVRWGRLLIEPFNGNKGDGGDLFAEALAIDPKHAGALLGMALIASEGFDKKAVELAGKALESDPKLVEAQELLASLALEDGDLQKARAEADKALKISAEALDAMAIHAAIQELEDKPAAEWLGRMAAVNPLYGQGHSLIAHHLVLNRRYEDGIAHYRKALELDPGLLEARSQLGINLMRLGREAEARQQLETAYNAGARDLATKNSLRLIDSYKNLVTFESSNTILKLNKKEADMLRIYFEPELRKAIAAYEKKYKVKLKAPVQLEVYPDHEDFAVRTMGMPGLGALGVTFGTVVAMDSPSGRKPGSFHWAGTLWHELSHVFVLSATNHRVPRWFTEGVAVHEESAFYPEWGDRLSPEIVMAIKDKKLLPVAELDRGFVRPSYPSQVIVSYFQGGRIIDFINQKWGFEKVLQMMHAFGARKSTPAVFQEVLGVAAPDFDKQFLAWLDKDTGAIVANFENWRKRIRELANLAKEKKYDEVLREGDQVINLYTEYVEAANAYEMVAEAAVFKGDKRKAIEVLARYAKTGGRDPEVLKKLATLQEEAGDKRGAAGTLAKILYIYPVKDEPLHRRLGDLYLSLNNPNDAIREFRVVLADKPLNKADAHYNLARAYRAAQQIDKAEEHVLEALESAPGYRPAQKLLLELNAAAASGTPEKKR